jgi:bifunctional DNA-binding transcriptional regulator/antitoxin component of YhaV-PrlF toxin-antitoxin module
MGDRHIAYSLANIRRGAGKMTKLIVDTEGKVTIPPEVIQKRGLRPGDELALVESAEGLLVYQGGVDAKTLEWWESLSDAEQRRAAAEAQRYEQLSAAAQEALWNEGAEAIEAEAEGDEVELPTTERPL